MSVYTVQGTQTAAAKTALTLISAATIRPRLIGYTLSQVGAVVLDSNFEIIGKRFTAAGTSTAVTPAAADSGDPAAVFTAGSNTSAEPTYTANTNFCDKGVNPRSTFRWAAYDQQSEIIMPSTAANGLGFLVNALGGAITITVDAEVRQ